MPKTNNKITLSLPPKLIEEIQKLIKEKKKTRNKFFKEAIKN